MWKEIAMQDYEEAICDPCTQEAATSTLARDISTLVWL